MVRWLIAFCWLCGNGLALAAGQLRVELPTAERPYTAELGRAFTVQLHYRGAADLERIPLTPWQEDFAIDRGYARRGDDQQQMRLRLTPRRSGEFTLPPLQLGPAHSEAQYVRIVPAMEGGEALDPVWQVSRHSAWQGEELLASLTLDSADPALRLETAEVRWADFSHQALPMERLPQADGRTRYRLRWLLRPLLSGTLPIAAPELRLVRDGVPRRRFRFPVEELQIQALPDYLPPNIAIGRLAAESDAQGRHWLLGHGITAVQLQAVLDRAGLSHKGLDAKQTPDGIESRALLNWVGFDGAGARLVFFDPASGRVSQLNLAAPSAPVWPWLLPLLVLLLAWLGWQRRRLGRWLQRVRQRRHLLSRLAATQDPLALKQALAPQGQSLADWLQAWQRDHRAPAELDATIQQLAACCYGQHCDPELATRLLRAVAASRARW